MLEKTIFHWITQYGYTAIVFLLMLGIVGLPVPDETLLTFSGYMVFKNRLHLAPTMLAAFTGSICGITISYFLGRTFGFYLFHKYGRYIHVTDERLRRTHQWLEHTGGWALMFGYYLPGIRHLAAYVAGTSEMRPHVFAAFAYSGALFWSATFVCVGYFMGDEWSQIARRLHPDLWLLTLIVVAAILIYLGARKAWRRG